GDTPPKDPYQGAFYTAYKSLIAFCIQWRWMTVMALMLMMAIAIYAFNQLEDSFFPDSTRPQFMVHYWLPEGTDIRKTSSDIAAFEKYILTLKGVTGVSTFVGAGAPRFILTYTPEKEYSSYGLLLVDVDNHEKINPLIATVSAYARDHYINAMVKARRFMLGPGKEDTLEVRFSGPSPTILRELANQAKKIMHADGNIEGIKDNWRERVKVIRPVIAEYPAREAGINKADIDETLQTVFGGQRIGVYRENDKLLPIVSTVPESERSDAASIKDIQIWSPLAQATIPFRQIVSDFTTSWNDNAINRRDRKRTITIAGSQQTGNASVTFARLQPKIEALKLPTGYEMAWGGQYEDSNDAKTALFKNIPITLVLVVLVLVMLFNAIRQPLIILLTVPLAVIGVAAGLLAMNLSFGFMALLGFLSLSGMLIKNSIVLIDQIDLEIREGKEPAKAILDSSAARMRPVAMAAVTTVLGLIPLLVDIFFVGMAVTIMAGLTFATILTLVVVPVLYALFFRVK
ncbi:MAG: efflux RND transporter permease subunit, partial [Pseudomonadota bacterium]|nr:efflux RND transporter permease subunit [Pseudomonadota bacterium]